VLTLSARLPCEEDLRKAAEILNHGKRIATLGERARCTPVKNATGGRLPPNPAKTTALAEE